MKLVIITAVASFREDIIKLLKKAKIDSYSGAEMDGYSHSESSSFSWFPGAKEGIDSHMFFAFTTSKQAENLINIVTEFNQCTVENKNFCIKVGTVPVDKYI
ncbi:hypothetical protein C7377_0429 [Balneicella halophila]|uniref:Nitrogen regulatory protein P-II family n=1 Tax=Balneicella halophila TaxID=1537566 RepID=A0A7L4UR38_BALHA|nr:hypothetical protein [Balneicella halophila]PVX52129.1 hypothetical protein C7377_0429 [Balneicella halophila]